MPQLADRSISHSSGKIWVVRTASKQRVGDNSLRADHLTRQSDECVLDAPIVPGRSKQKTGCRAQKPDADLSRTLGTRSPSRTWTLRTSAWVDRWGGNSSRFGVARGREPCLLTLRLKITQFARDFCLDIVPGACALISHEHNGFCTTISLCQL